MSSSSSEGPGECDHCLSELTNPYWKCSICPKFDICCDCYFEVQPRPTTATHLATHPLEVVVESISEDDNFSDTEDSWEIFRNDAMLPPSGVPRVNIQIVSRDTTPNDSDNESIDSDPPPWEYSSSDDYFSSEDDDNPENTKPFYYRVKKD